MSYIIHTQYDCSFSPVLSMCIMGAFNYMIIHYFCHKTPALITWQYSAAGWLTFCSPSKLWIVISSANIQTLLLMTLSHRLLLKHSLCFVTKQNTKYEHPTSALFPNKFIHCTDFTKGFRVISLCHYLCFYSASKVSEAWSFWNTQFLFQSGDLLPHLCQCICLFVFFLSLITCPHLPSVQSSNISGQFLCPS